METLKEKGGKVSESLVHYLELRMRLLTLKGAEKGAQMASGFLTVLILIVIFIFSTVLLSIGLAILISSALGSSWAGFFIVGAFYLLLGIVLVSMRKTIIFEPLLNAIVNALVGVELKVEEKIEHLQDDVEDKLNLDKQPDQRSPF